MALAVTTAEIVAAAGVDHHGFFFVDQANSFTAGDLFNLGETAFEGHDDHGDQQSDQAGLRIGCLLTNGIISCSMGCNNSRQLRDK